MQKEHKKLYERVFIEIFSFDKCVILSSGDTEDGDTSVTLPKDEF